MNGDCFTVSLDRKLDVALYNTAEVMTLEELRNILGKSRTVAYYGTAPTGPVHLGYFIPLAKLLDLSSIGVETIVLLADIHASLDDQKTKWEDREIKTEYYKKCIELALPWVVKPRFIVGSSFQTKKDYIMDVLKGSSDTTVNRAMRAASEVTRMKEPKVSELIYPIMQALDEQYLGADIQVGGLDQRHIFALARELHPLLGYNPKVEIMLPIVLSLKGDGKKMSASDPKSHIKIYDSEETIRKKISEAYCPAGTLEGNPIIQLIHYIIFPVRNEMSISRDKKFGGDVVFESFDALQAAFANGNLHPLDLKRAVANVLIELFAPARTYFDGNSDILKRLGENYL